MDIRTAIEYVGHYIAMCVLSFEAVDTSRELAGYELDEVFDFANGVLSQNDPN